MITFKPILGGLLALFLAIVTYVACPGAMFGGRVLLVVVVVGLFGWLWSTGEPLVSGEKVAVRHVAEEAEPAPVRPVVEDRTRRPDDLDGTAFL